MFLIEVLNVGFEANGTTLLHPISFAVEKGGRLAVAGITGSGKSTLLKLLAGILQPTSGHILFNGEKLAGPAEKLLPGHPAIAYLSQHFELRNNYFVYELLEMHNKLSAAEAGKIYRICRVDHLFARRTDQLSGGERQRIVMAQMLTTRPSLLLLDEPFSNADLQHKTLLKSILNEINRQLHTAIILVSHDPAEVLSWGHRMMLLKNGHLVQQGTPYEIYHRPVNEYVASLTGYYNMLTPSLAAALGVNDGRGTGLTIIRPEQLERRSGTGTVEGIVTTIEFMGHFSIVEVSVGENRLKLMLTADVPSPGDKMQLGYCR